MNINDVLTRNKIVKMYAGSIAYGTSVPSSDVDYRGLFVADPINIRTPFFPVKEYEDTLEEDTKYYELAHFCKLCADNNPNVAELLWTDETDIVETTEAYQILRDNRLLFLSSKIAFTTTGYAMAQLKRIKGHNKWINNPQPIEPPRQIDYISMVFNLEEYKLFKREFNLSDFYEDHRLVPYGNDIYGLYRAEGYHPFNKNTFNLNTAFDAGEGFHQIELNNKWFRQLIGSHTSYRRRPIAIVKFNKEQYQVSKDTHKNYWTWKKNRNESRSALEEQFGYDSKHAMHLVRLMRMGYEALEQGKLIVKRPDAEELLAIRKGSRTYEEIVAYAEFMDAEVKRLYKTTSLPKTADVKQISKVLMDVQESIWYNS